MKHSLDDTITSIVTPPGLGGVGMVRISGKDALFISRSAIENFPNEIEPRRVYHGWAISKGKRIDQTVYYYMKAPASYTGEDIVEISCHGGPRILNGLLGQITASGARLAQRGEFTLRAFLNGKMDLVQAESVIDLINAKSNLSLEAASLQLGGNLSRAISNIRAAMIKVLAGIEAEIDFPDSVEGGGEQTAVEAGHIIDSIDQLLSSADTGKALREGVRTAIIGKPNVGKSSIMNALLEEERMIVTDQPGTTRDIVEETINIEGIPMMIIDTAGIRHPQDKAEEFGVTRSRQEMHKADYVLLVIDASKELSQEDRMILEEAKDMRTILILNKIDLGNKLKLNGYSNLRQVRTSALTGTGIDELKTTIINGLNIGGIRLTDNVGAINIRHKASLERAKEAMLRLLNSQKKGMTADLLAIDLKQGIIELGEITGEEVSEEIIENIFNKFCIGK